MSILKLKDGQGNWVGVPTIKGDDGNGISSAVLNSDYTLTLTFTDGTTYTTPSIRGEKGEQGDPATSMEIHICSSSEYDSQTRIPTIAQPNNKTFYLVPTSDATSPDLFTEWVYVNNAWEMFGSASVDLSGYLTDVTVNGTSVVTDGVANIPIAGTSGQKGVISIANPFFMEGSALLLMRASSDRIKNGTDNIYPLVSSKQHESVFYGLAKASGDTTQSASSNPVGQYTDEAKSAIQNMLNVPSKSDIPEVPVEDVQINGSSIVTDGVANVPIASNSTLGAVKTHGSYGLATFTTGVIRTDPAVNRGISVGTDGYHPIVPLHQHESTFYGLAKAAGDTTQSQSSNAVGTYTDEAKDKIQTMLGVSPLIAPHESDPFESNHVIGELFIINGKLYRAKTALTAGEYINEGTNVEVVNTSDVYVKNTDYADNGKYGLVKLSTLYGIRNYQGVLATKLAGNDTLKRGTDQYDPVVASNANAATFYGLAKASGDTTQSQSDNAVGTYTDEAKASIQTMLGVPSEDDVVSDVQINGTSIITDGVANIPYAAYNKVGVVQVNENRGTYMLGSTLCVSAADSSLIKTGTHINRPIVPNTQHESVFYGLAKASGDVTQASSSNAVGTYTDEAKTAIRNMIGASALEDQGQDIILNTKTGNRITITDYKDNTNVQSAIVNIAPTQSYNGYSKPWGAGKGKNLCPDLAHMSSYTDYPYITHGYDENTHTWTITDTIGGQSTWRQARFFFDASAMAGKRVYLSYQSFTRHFGDVDSQVGMSSISFAAGGVSVWVSPSQNKKWIDVPSDVDLTNAEIGFRLAQSDGNLLAAGAYITVTGLQLEIGSAATEFEPYENLCPINGTSSIEIEHKIGTTTNTIIEDFSNNIGVIYSGSYNILTGVVEKCSYYSSYNGESINGTWMSDRDVYEIGALPTIGAEVAEIGGNTTSYTVNSHIIPLSVGINTIEIDSNTLSIEYYATIERKSIYKNKTLSILGDSLSTFNGYLPEGNPHYYPLIDVQSVNDTWWMKLINALGMELNTNNSWSGAKVSGTATSAGSGNRATELGTSPDVIIIWMGANDFLNSIAIGDYDGKSAVPTSVTTFSDAYAVMLNKVLTTYPDAEVWVCTLHQFEYMNDDGFPETNNSGLTLKDYNDVILTLADAFGVRVLENHKCGMTYQNRSKWYSGKNPHPNKAGHSMIANNAIRQMDNYIRTRY